MGILGTSSPSDSGLIYMCVLPHACKESEIVQKQPGTVNSRLSRAALHMPVSSFFFYLGEAAENPRKLICFVRVRFSTLRVSVSPR